MDFRKYLPVAACSLVLCAGQAQAQISFPGFNSGNVGSGAGQITVNGSAEVVSPALRVTSDAFQQGSAFFNNLILLRDGFSTSFDYTIGGGTHPADGLAFLISNDPAGANAAGWGGSGLGFQTLSNTVGVTLNTFSDPGIHVKDGDDNVYASTPKAVSDLRGSHNVKIDFTNVAAGVGDIKVTLDNIPTLTLPGFNLNPFLNGAGEARVGFGSGTGLYSDQHDVTLWALNNAPQPGTPGGGPPPAPPTPPTPVPPPPPAPSSIPEPTTLALAGLGGLLALARRRR